MGREVGLLDRTMAKDKALDQRIGSQTVGPHNPRMGKLTANIKIMNLGLPI